MGMGLKRVAPLSRGGKRRRGRRKGKSSFHLLGKQEGKSLMNIKKFIIYSVNWSKFRK
jgi:hypothetical protein